MRLFLAATMMVMTTAAFAEDPKPANIDRWYVDGLYVDQLKDVEIVDKKTGEIEGETYLQYARAKFTFDVLPYGCNATFLKAEIIGKLESADPYADEPHYDVRIGHLVDGPNTAEICIGVPPREVRVTLPLVNGYGVNADKDTTYSYNFPGPREDNGGPSQVTVEILVNQVEQTVRVLN